MAAGILWGAGVALAGYLASRWGAGAGIVTRDKNVIPPLPQAKPQTQPLPQKPATKPPATTPPTTKPPTTKPPATTPVQQPAEPPAAQQPPPEPAAPPPDDEPSLPTPPVPPVQTGPALPAPELEPEPMPEEQPPAPAPEPPPAAEPEDEEPAPTAEEEPPPPPAPAPPPPDTTSPVPTPVVRPPVPTDITPEGFDPVAARTLAKKLAANLQAAGRDRYDRSLTREFQRAAGIDADGIYGGETKGALLAYGISSPPNAFFAPVATVPYRWAALLAEQPATDQSVVYSQRPAEEPPPDAPPAGLPSAEEPPETPPQSTAAPSEQPPAGFNPTTARKLAKAVANNITNKGANYSHEQLRSFQRAAGIDADGLYGGSSRGALIFFGVPRPPATLFKPTQTVPYRWAEYPGASA